MKTINFSAILQVITLLLLAMTIFILLGDGISKPLVIGLIAISTTFGVLSLITLRNIERASKVDRSQKILDIIFSTFELHAHKLPEGEEFDFQDYIPGSEAPSSKKKKVDSFEIHL